MRWLRPDPTSILAHLHSGKSVNPGSTLLNLVWTLWFLGDVLYGQPWKYRSWLFATVVGWCLCIFIWLKAWSGPRSQVPYLAMAMTLLGLVEVHWNYSGASCCIIYACSLFGWWGTPRSAFLAMASADGALIVLAFFNQWPLSALVGVVSLSAAVGAGNLVRRASLDSNARLRLTHEEIHRLAATAERERIGRDLHDLLGHTLSLITLKSELANKLFDRDAAAAKREMVDVERVARDALAQVRRAVTGIRAAGIAAELASAKLLLESNGVHLSYALADVALPVELETALAMTLREAVTNIQRHARATQASVSLETNDKTLSLRIDDNGRGGDIVPGNGLSGMRERLAAVGAQLSIDSQRGKGTLLTVTAPLPQGANLGEQNTSIAVRRA